MKTKKQTETNENQSVITNSLSGNKVFFATSLLYDKEMSKKLSLGCLHCFAD